MPDQLCLWLTSRYSISPSVNMEDCPRPPTSGTDQYSHLSLPLLETRIFSGTSILLKSSASITYRYRRDPSRSEQCNSENFSRRDFICWHGSSGSVASTSRYLATIHRFTMWSFKNTTGTKGKFIMWEPELKEAELQKSSGLATRIAR